MKITVLSRDMMGMGFHILKEHIQKKLMCLTLYQENGAKVSTTFVVNAIALFHWFYSIKVRTFLKKFMVEK